MSCDALMAAAEARSARCSPTEDGWLLSLAVTYPDGDIPQIFARRGEGHEWVLDDLGVTAGRIFDRGSEWSAAMDNVIEGIAEANRLSFSDGTLSISCTETELPDALRRLTSALLQADAVHLLAPPEREETFSDHVVRFLRELDVDLRPKHRIEVSGRSFTVTGTAYRSAEERRRRDYTVVQAARDQQAIEHAHYIASSIARSGRPAERFLTVVSDQAYKRKADIHNLTDVSYVSHMSTPATVQNWLNATDEDRRTFSRELPQASLG